MQQAHSIRSKAVLTGGHPLPVPQVNLATDSKKSIVKCLKENTRTKESTLTSEVYFFSYEMQYEQQLTNIVLKPVA